MKTKFETNVTRDILSELKGQVTRTKCLHATSDYCSRLYKGERDVTNLLRKEIEGILTKFKNSGSTGTKTYSNYIFRTTMNFQR